MRQDESLMRWRGKQVFEFASTALAVVAAASVLWTTYGPPISRPSRPAQPVSLSIEGEKLRHTRGGGAKVLVEFSDFECPFCGRHARETGPQIESAFLERGDVEHVFLHFPLPNHPFAMKAAEAAECAGAQDRFWEMHTALFANQSALRSSDLLGRAKDIGIDVEAFRRCLLSGSMAPRIESDLAEGRRLHVVSTPAFFIGVTQSDGSIALTVQIAGAQQFQVFERTFRDLGPVRAPYHP